MTFIALSDDTDASVRIPVLANIGRPEAGYDTCILVVPPDMLADPKAKAVMLPLMLGKLALEQAADLGERLRESTWWITRDADEIRVRGLAHDCDVCRDGVELAMDAVRQDPDLMMAVGYLSFAQ